MSFTFFILLGVLDLQPTIETPRTLGPIDSMPALSQEQKETLKTLIGRFLDAPRDFDDLHEALPFLRRRLFPSYVDMHIKTLLILENGLEEIPGTPRFFSELRRTPSFHYRNLGEGQGRYLKEDLTEMQRGLYFLLDRIPTSDQGFIIGSGDHVFASIRSLLMAWLGDDGEERFDFVERYLSDSIRMIRLFYSLSDSQDYELNRVMDAIKLAQMSTRLRFSVRQPVVRYVNSASLIRCFSLLGDL